MNELPEDIGLQTGRLSRDISGAQVSSGQKFKLGSFEGPLDLLLFLIKKSEINIYDIPIAAITEQYLEILTSATEIDLENITEFYLMAATLLYVKSRMLLPVEVRLDDEFEDPRRELVDHLIEYQKYKKLSELVQEREKEVEWALEREKTQRVLPFQDEDIWDKINVWDLLRTFSAIMSSFSPEKLIDLYEEVSINEKITLINEILDSGRVINFYELIIKKDSIMEVICSFLAILEMVKSKLICIYQNKLFGDICIGGIDDA